MTPRGGLCYSRIMHMQGGPSSLRLAPAGALALASLLLRLAR